MCEQYKDGRMLSYEQMCPTHREKHYGGKRGLESIVGPASTGSLHSPNYNTA